ncbi:hypothetical protein ACHAXT_009138 [Thalassiosira profunda]
MRASLLLLASTGAAAAFSLTSPLLSRARTSSFDTGLFVSSVEKSLVASVDGDIVDITPAASDSLKVFIIGGPSGLIGSTLLEMMTETYPNPGIDCVGACDISYGVKFSPDGEDETTTWIDGIRFNDEYIASCAAPGANICVVDCSASEEIADRYEGWLSRGWHVVTPNKKCNSGPLDRYQRTLQASKAKENGEWYCECTIGAGLPIVSTIRTYKATGDEIRAVRGIFSGTMSFLFNEWDGKSRPFSEVVASAKDKGYTEPDPRDDLNGMDVARKVVIAARESGLPLSLEDVEIESLVPDNLKDVSPEEFLRRFGEGDAAMAARAAKADAAGNVLRFVGEVDVVTQKATAKLAEFPKSHPFAGLSGADNIIEIVTKRYGPEMASTPLIVRGPGAGAYVTAAGVYGDVVSLFNSKNCKKESSLSP